MTSAVSLFGRNWAVPKERLWYRLSHTIDTQFRLHLKLFLEIHAIMIKHRIVCVLVPYWFPINGIGCRKLSGNNMSLDLYPYRRFGKIKCQVREYVFSKLHRIDILIGIYEHVFLFLTRSILLTFHLNYTREQLIFRPRLPYKLGKHGDVLWFKGWCGVSLEFQWYWNWS